MNSFRHTPWDSPSDEKPITPPEKKPNTSLPKWTPPRHVLVIVGIAIVAVAILATIAQQHHHANDDDTAPEITTTPARPPHQASPAGWGQPGWSAAHRLSPSGAVLTGETVWSLSTTASGTPTLEGRAAADGAVTSATELPAGSTGPWETQIDETPVIITRTSDTLRWAPTADPAQGHATPAKGGGLHATSQCAWLDHGTTAEILTADGTSRRTIPQGARVAGCTPGGLLAADNQGHVWDLTNEKPAKPHTITPPAPPARVQTVIGAQNGTLAIEWNNHTVTWWDTTTHTVVSTHPGAPEGITASRTPQRGRWTAAGSVIIDWQNRSLIPIDGNLDAVIDHWAWTHDPQAHTSTMIDLGTGTTTTSPVTATPARPLGIAQNHLIVLSDDDQGRLNLYGLKSA